MQWLCRSAFAKSALHSSRQKTLHASPISHALSGSRLQLHLRRPASTVSSSPNVYHNIATVLALSDDTSFQQPKPIEITGHVRTIRNQKRRSFVEIGDGSTTSSLQALLDPTQAIGLSTGTSIRISGLWQPSPSAKEQSHELHAREVEIMGPADASTYPIQKKYHSSEFLRTIPHLRLRVPSNALLARLRSDCEYYISNHFRALDFVRAYPPIITSSDCEGAGEVFTIQSRQEDAETVEHDDSGTNNQDGKREANENFFRNQKYLTVSSQLHLEAYVHEHPRVWTLSPTFRAEKSDTPRHLSEFYMLEAELRADSLSQVMDVVEALIKDVAVGVQNSMVGKELLDAAKLLEKDDADASMKRGSVLLENRWRGLRKQYWPRISYTSAINYLQAAQTDGDVTFERKPTWSDGLQLEHEKYIAAEIGLGSPVFVTDYPAKIKPFYMLPNADSLAAESQTASCFDLLMPDLCEVVGGSMREHRFAELQKSMENHGLLQGEDQATTSTNSLDWYVDLRRYGTVAHGGFGLGFDRLLCYLSGVENVRDMIPWPRYYGRCDG